MVVAAAVTASGGVVVVRRRERARDRRRRRILKSLREILGVGISHRRGASGTLWRFPLYSDNATIFTPMKICFPFKLFVDIYMFRI